jgi:serine O-acetyltransferase
MFRMIRKDLERFSNGPGLSAKVKISFTSIGFTTVVLIRLQSFLYRHKCIFLAYLVHHLNLILTGADVLPGSQIGAGLRIEHPVGLVIGAGVRIGENCTIMQGVTLGVKNIDRTRNDHAYPTIGDNVSIGSKASILGGINIGSNSTIGAHAVVMDDAPPGSCLTGIPARESRNKKHNNQV